MSKCQDCIYGNLLIKYKYRIFFIRDPVVIISFINRKELIN